MGEVVTVASGKGGVGKTSIVANLAKFLSLHKKVLALDLDFYTRGLTHFFNWRIEGKYLSEMDISDFFQDFKNIDDIKNYLNKNFNKLCINISPNLYFIPAASSIDKAVPLVPEFNVDALGYILEYLKSKFDFIVIDTRAGADTGALMSTLFSDLSILVSEEDIISQMSSNTFIMHIGRFQEKYKRLLKKFDKEKTQPSSLMVFNKVIRREVITNAFKRSIDRYLISVRTRNIPYERRVKKAFLNGEYVIEKFPASSFAVFLRMLSFTFLKIPRRKKGFRGLMETYRYLFSSQFFLIFTALYACIVTLFFLIQKTGLNQQITGIFIGILIGFLFLGLIYFFGFIWRIRP